MLILSKNETPKCRCIVTTTKLSNFLDHEQPPTKKRPFNTILDRSFTHTLNLLLPEPAAEKLRDHLQQHGLASFTYYKLHLKLHEILTGPIFNDLIKSPSSNVILIHKSPNRIITLSDGILRLEVDKPTFEKLGLQGKLIPSDGGRKHVKSRYGIELNLRLPSMVSGKPGFERVTWAAKNVLVESVTWLFCDLDDVNGAREVEALKEFHPFVRKVEPDVVKTEKALVPSVPDEGFREEEWEDAAELLEWLSLAMLPSGRINERDDIDKLFSRYRVPVLRGEEVRTEDLVRFRWRGLVPATFAYKVLIAAMKVASEQFVAIDGAAFDGHHHMVLVKDGHSTTWEYKE